MDNYKPIKTPFWKQMIKSPLFSILSLFLLGYGVLTALKNPSLFETTHLSTMSNRQIAKKAITPAKSEAPSLPKSSPEGEGAAPVVDSEPTGLAPQTNIPPKIPTQDEQTVEATPLQAELPVSNKHPGAEVTSQDTEREHNSQNSIKLENLKGPLELEVRFVEAPISQIQRFQSESTDEATGDTGEMRFAIVKNSAKWFNHSAFTELDHISKKVPGVKKKIQWFSGAQDPETGAPFGLNFQVSIQERNAGHIAGDLFISRSLVDHTTSEPLAIRKEFMTQFETDVGSVIGLTGLMPHTPIRIEEREWLQDSLLRVFLSTPYLQNETDLLILLQFKGDSK